MTERTLVERLKRMAKSEEFEGYISEAESLREAADTIERLEQQEQSFKEILIGLAPKLGLKNGYAEKWAESVLADFRKKRGEVG